MYKCNIRARSRNNCCRARAISITYSECVPVGISYPTFETLAPHFVIICGLSGCKIFLHISQTARFSGTCY